MLAVPEDEGTKSTPTRQTALSVVEPGTRVQVPDEVNIPVTPEKVKLTLPAGDAFVPPPEFSVTVAVQCEGWFTTTPLSQETDVEVVRGPGLTVTLKGEAVLPL